MNPQSIGEQQMTPQVIQTVAPDVVSPQGKQQLFTKLANATIQQKNLDSIFQQIADKVHADFSSRIKDPRTIVQKIAQKRIQGREYDIENINDAYGSRIIVKNGDQINKVKSLIDKVKDNGLFKINKSEMVSTDYHKSWHIDFTTKNGIKGEVQIITPKEEAKSVVNHDIRNIYGEKLAGNVKKLADAQADKVESLSDAKARVISQAIAKGRKLSGNQNLDPRVLAQVLQKA